MHPTSKGICTAQQVYRNQQSSNQSLPQASVVEIPCDVLDPDSKWAFSLEDFCEEEQSLKGQRTDMKIDARVKTMKAKLILPKRVKYQSFLVVSIKNELTHSKKTALHDQFQLTSIL